MSANSAPPRSFYDDLDVVDSSTVETTGPSYPVAQWLNGEPRMAAAGGVAHTGGIILPEKYLPSDIAPAPGWTVAKIAFNNGKTESVLACQKPRLAVLRTRFRWFVVRGGVTTYYPRSDYRADSGMRGHVQALCAVPGWNFPIVVTFKGKASQEFERLLKEFAQKIAEATARQMRETQKPGEPARRLPRFAFYLRLAPGPHVKVGQKGQESIVTPPVLELPAVISADFLGKVYVGRERLVDLQHDYHQSADWAGAWDRAGAEGEPDDPGSVDQSARDEPPGDGQPTDPPLSDPAPRAESGGAGQAAPDVLSSEQALKVLHLHRIDKELLRQALIEDHGRPTYSPERDTALVRRIVAQHSGPPRDDEVEL